MKILVVEDSSHLRRALVRGLEHSGYAVDATGDGGRGLMLASSRDYDVIVLDLSLPTMDGMEVLRQLRRDGVSTFVLVLTARIATGDRVRGLRGGADDYLTKPFEFEELLARVEALTRRSHGECSNIMELCEGLVLDLSRRTLLAHGEEVQLAPREYSLLEYLAMRRGHAVSRYELQQHVYPSRRLIVSNSVDSAICSLRKKLAAGGFTKLITTMRGFGYVLEAP